MDKHEYKYGLLIAPTGNLGDDIQSLVAALFLPRIDVFIDRDKTRLFRSNVPTKVIMNGWFTHRPENWPPSGDIVPLFISFHISPSVKENLLSEKGVEYLKQFEPIGARDTYTQHLLLERGVESYWSGCLTLTLGKHLKLPRIGGQVAIIDLEEEALLALPKDLRSHAITESNQLFPRLTSLLTALQQSSLARTLKRSIRPYFHPGRLSADLYRLLSRNIGPVKRIQLALSRLVVIASSELVLTSRLHVALPALAFNTPVIFVHSNLSDPRFGGFLPFLNHYQTTGFREIAGTISWDKVRNPNSDELENVKDTLFKEVRAFLNR
ncbi:polysaccharide pyruvyl transferase family protein [Thermus sp.]|uniref:polysaccharide pyruvyl transferase family protein n=1 Tax=Thermus sp. TaxID=275 RepID=UPI00298EF74E|nr:polysaccharide pyruvyl transferase family protein [Thermus sp.]